MPKEFPKNDVNRKAIYLALWIIAFIIMSVVIVSHSNEKNNNKPKNNKEETPYVDDDFEIKDDIDVFNTYKENLLKLNYRFKYTHTINGYTVIYNGTSMGNIISLTREDINGIQRLYIENDILYIESLDQRVQSDVLVNHENYLDVDYLFSHAGNPIKVEEHYELTIDGYPAFIYIKNDNISRIEFNTDQEQYILEFNDVNQIENID